MMGKGTIETTASQTDEIRLLICDDHQLLTECLATVVDSWHGVSLVADPVTTADEAVAVCGEERPDVVLMDVHLNGEDNGIEATRRISLASQTTRVIMLTGDRSDRWLSQSLEAGASGVLQKADAVDHLQDAVRTVAGGGSLFEPEELPDLMRVAMRQRTERLERERRLARLTGRERQVIECLRDGWRNDRIAAELFISPRTVEAHVQNISHKLGVHSKLEAVAFLRDEDEG